MCEKLIISASHPLNVKGLHAFVNQSLPWHSWDTRAQDTETIAQLIHVQMYIHIRCQHDKIFLRCAVCSFFEGAVGVPQIASATVSVLFMQ